MENEGLVDEEDEETQAHANTKETHREVEGDRCRNPFAFERSNVLIVEIFCRLAQYVMGALEPKGHTAEQAVCRAGSTEKNDPRQTGGMDGDY